MQSTDISCSDIIASAIANFDWKSKSKNAQVLTEKLLQIARKWGLSPEQLLEKSLDEAKTLQNYSYIEPPHTNTEFNGMQFFIHIDTDNEKRVWVIFRRKLKQEISDESKELIKYLGAVYLHIGKNLDVSIDTFPDNIVQITYDKTYGRTNQYNTCHYPKYLRGYSDCFSFQKINPFIHMNCEYLEYINTFAENIDNIPFNTKTIKVKKYGDYTEHDLSNLPYGINKIILNGGLFSQSFTLIPPTVESMEITNFRSQLNGFPSCLKKLIIHNAFDNLYYCPKKSEYKAQVINEHFTFISDTELCDGCEDGTTLLKYKYNYNNTEFPEGFEHLTLQYNKSLYILNYITKIPSTFTKLTITDMEMREYYKKYSADDPYYLEVLTENNKLIDDFVARFPNVEIIYQDA